MATTILTAKVTTVPLGLISVEGLLLEDGTFAISIPQANELISFSASNNVASRDLKRLFGNGFSPSKVKSDQSKQLINCLTLPDLERLIAKLDRLGNLKAQEFRDALVGLSLKQLFADAFKIQFESEERQAYLAARMQGKLTRRSMTDAIKEWCDRNNKPEKVTGYCVCCSDTLNLYLFGNKSKEEKEKRSVASNKPLRDYLTSDELYQVDRIEDRVLDLVDLDNIKPTDAIKMVIERLNRRNQPATTSELK